MNANQKKCLIWGIAVIAIMGAFPPWRMYSCAPQSHIKRYEPADYSFIAEPPKPRWSKYRVYGVAIDLPRLLIQWAVVAVITGGLFVALKDKKPKDKQKE